jgi:hypothetical protein
VLYVLYTRAVASDERATATMTATAAQPQWELRVEEDGNLTAVLTGSDPPVTVSGESLSSLRKQITKTMLRGRIR